MKQFLFLTFSLSNLFLFDGKAIGCTAISLRESAKFVSGYNCDWHQKHGYLLLNPRSYKKTSLVLDPKEKTIQWVAKYGSITFNQHGREFPAAGINERGLSINVLWLESTVYPDSVLPKLIDTQWVQYLLDTSANIDEAVERAREVSIASHVAKFHYFMCDAHRECAVFEFLAGKTIIHRREGFPVETLTNDEYAVSLKAWGEFDFSGDKRVPLDNSSISRFIRATYFAKQFDKKQQDPAQHVLDTLSVAIDPFYTIYTVVYENGARKLRFRSHGNNKIRSLDLSQLDFSCKRGPQWVDMDAPYEGDLSKLLQPYAPEQNLKLVRLGLAPYLPPEAQQVVANYPSSFLCE